MSGPTVTKDDILKASAGMLQKQLYVVFTTPTNGLGPVMENIEEHLKFQVDLEQRGIMLGAGPFWADDEHTWSGEGMVLIRADSLEHARQIAETDPMHSSGARSFTVRPWLLNEGRITVEVNFSTGRHAVS
ncbi:MULTISPECIES: YciI family protein [unclassified Roseibium]|uniref:YciI family protein n=1 Tax=unclassified Roseibium TaxID=2629323 RepID=UPI00273D9743|nr:MULTISPECIES: YciI family protein [unclassified Roseibium]